MNKTTKIFTDIKLQWTTTDTGWNDKIVILNKQHYSFI